jgi:hypothetical protein
MANQFKEKSFNTNVTSSYIFLYQPLTRTASHPPTRWYLFASANTHNPHLLLEKFLLKSKTHLSICFANLVCSKLQQDDCLPHFFCLDGKTNLSTHHIALTNMDAINHLIQKEHLREHSFGTDILKVQGLVSNLFLEICNILKHLPHHLTLPSLYAALSIVQAETLQKDPLEPLINWFQPKNSNPWVLKCLCYPLTSMNAIDWIETSFTTNIVESAHALSQKYGTACNPYNNLSR